MSAPAVVDVATAVDPVAADIFAARKKRTHPKGCGFRFNKREKFIYNVKTGYRLPEGILKGHARDFYPTWTFKTATRDAVITDTFNVSMSGPSMPRGMPLNAWRKASIKRGTLFDAQMTRTTTYFKKYKLTHEFFFDDAVRAAWTKTIVPEHVHRYCKRVNVYTRGCWQLLARRDLSPVASQVCVACPRTRRGTMVDLVCKDSKGRFVPCELKSGYSKTFYKTTGSNMKGPFWERKDCPFNQHQIQLLESSELYRRAYWSKVEPSLDSHQVMGRPLLIRVREDEGGGTTVDTHELRPWAITALPEMMAHYTRVAANEERVHSIAHQRRPISSAHRAFAAVTRLPRMV